MTIFNMRKYPAMHCTGPLKQPIEFCPFVMQHRFMCQMCREVGHWSVMRVPQKTLRFHFESFPNIHNCWLKACVGQTCVTVRQGPIWWQRVNYKRSTRGRGGDMWHMFHLVAFHCQPSSNIGLPNIYCSAPVDSAKITNILLPGFSMKLMMKATMHPDQHLVTGLAHWCQEQRRCSFDKDLSSDLCVFLSFTKDGEPPGGVMEAGRHWYCPLCIANKALNRIFFHSIISMIM